MNRIGRRTIRHAADRGAGIILQNERASCYRRLACFFRNSHLPSRVGRDSIFHKPLVLQLHPTFRSRSGQQLPMQKSRFVSFGQYASEQDQFQGVRGATVNLTHTKQALVRSRLAQRGSHRRHLLRRRSGEVGSARDGKLGRSEPEG